MRPNFPGGYPPGGQWTRDDGGGRWRRRKKKGGFLKAVGGLIACVVVTFAVSALILALPLLLDFDPWDAAEFVDAPGFAKIDAFLDGWWHKQGMGEITFSHDGRSITIFDDNGALSGVERSGYGDDDDGFAADLAEARRILKEWGLSE